MRQSFLFSHADSSYPYNTWLLQSQIDKLMIIGAPAPPTAPMAAPARENAPDGCTIEYKSIEVSPGGRFHYFIGHPVHGKNWVIGTYIEILPPKKIAFTIRFSNEKGDEIDTTENKNLAFWPREILITVTFESLGNQTKAVIHETVSEEKAKKTGAYRGWIEMFVKLNHQLTNL